MFVIEIFDHTFSISFENYFNAVILQLIKIGMFIALHLIRFMTIFNNHFKIGVLRCHLNLNNKEIKITIVLIKHFYGLLYKCGYKNMMLTNFTFYR